MVQTISFYNESPAWTEAKKTIAEGFDTITDVAKDVLPTAVTEGISTAVEGISTIADVYKHIVADPSKLTSRVHPPAEPSWNDPRPLSSREQLFEAHGQ